MRRLSRSITRVVPSGKLLHTKAAEIVDPFTFLQLDEVRPSALRRIRCHKATALPWYRMSIATVESDSDCCDDSIDPPTADRYSVHVEMPRRVSRTQVCQMNLLTEWGLPMLEQVVFQICKSFTD